MSDKKVLYIALVMVTCFVDGQRVDVQPGDPVPDLSEHDIAELLRMKAIKDPAAEAAAQKQEAKDEKAAGDEFQAAREAVQAADASIKPAADAPAAKTAGKKAAAAT